MQDSDLEFRTCRRCGFPTKVDKNDKDDLLLCSLCRRRHRQSMLEYSWKNIFEKMSQRYYDEISLDDIYKMEKLISNFLDKKYGILDKKYGKKD